MTDMTWTDAPADLFGLEGSDLGRCIDRDSRLRIGVSPAPRVAPFQGSGAPAVAVPASNVPASNVPASKAPYAHNSIGTTFGIHPPRRPQS